MDDDTAAVLASVVPLGDTPTPQAEALAAAVAERIANRPPGVVELGGSPTLGQRLCKTWGLDPNRVSRITIKITPTDVPTVNIEMYADDGLGFLLIPYRLEERP
jgi:hypothetical protein